ncbi:MAG: response regulator transcription factor [Crocinitomicaceae bacterium]|nr:response regulator transcription factor [Crocinitomicaceae bacterium]
MKVLIVEDEKDLRETIATSLAKEHFVIETAKDFYSASEKMEIYDYDCILLDIMLPNGSGLQLLEQLKKQGKAGNVIIISAKNSLYDKLKGLELGADDYLTKPFHIAELNARIKAVLRRQKMDGKSTIETANIVLDIKDRTFSVNKKNIPLNRKEFDILNYFLFNKNRLVTKAALAEHVWGDYIDKMDNYDFIYYQIKNLRKKLSESKAEIEIEAVYGIGYKLVENEIT